MKRLEDYLYYEEKNPDLKIYLGDCLEIMPLIPKVDLVVTDPPFEQEAHTLKRRVKREGGVMEVEPLEFPPMDELTRIKSSEMIASLATRWILTFCQVEAAPIWRKAYEDFGMNYRRTCIWVKPDGMPQYSGDRPGMGYETLLAMHVKGKSEWNGGGRHGVYVFNKNDNGGRPNLHPTTKPKPLMRQIIQDFSSDQNLILDPFLGSGTTLVACKELNRNGIGIEINEKYCEIAKKRLQNTTRSLFNVKPQTDDRPNADLFGDLPRKSSRKKLAKSALLA